MKLSARLLIGPLIAACVSTSACVTINSSAISDRSGAGSAVSASASDFGYLHLVAPQGLTHAATANLLTQCATGKMTGVATELSMREFLIVQLYEVAVTGTCQ